MDSGRAPRLIAGAVSGLILVSALVMGVGALVGGPKPVWFLAGFEVVIAVAGVIGVLTGAGRFREGPALALACVAGAVLVGTLLGCISAQWTLAGHGLRPALLGRTAAAGLIVLTAVWMVMANNPREAVPRLVRGVVFGVVLIGAMGALWVMRGRIATMSMGLRFVAGTIGFLALTGLLAASVHLVIDAFVVAGRTRDGDPGGS